MEFIDINYTRALAIIVGGLEVFHVMWFTENSGRRGINICLESDTCHLAVWNTCVVPTRWALHAAFGHRPAGFQKLSRIRIALLWWKTGIILYPQIYNVLYNYPGFPVLICSLKPIFQSKIWVVSYPADDLEWIEYHDLISLSFNLSVFLLTCWSLYLCRYIYMSVFVIFMTFILSMLSLDLSCIPCILPVFWPVCFFVCWSVSSYRL